MVVPAMFTIFISTVIMFSVGVIAENNTATLMSAGSFISFCCALFVVWMCHESQKG